MGDTSDLPVSLIVITILLATVLGQLSRIDLREQRLPDAYTLPLILIGLGWHAYVTGTLPISQIWGAIIGYVTFWAIGTLFYKRTGHEGLGLGDAKLLSAAGAWLGVATIPWVVLVSALGALTYAFLTRCDRSQRLAFGPWLATSFFLFWVGKWFV